MPVVVHQTDICPSSLCGSAASLYMPEACSHGLRCLLLAMLKRRRFLRNSASPSCSLGGPRRRGNVYSVSGNFPALRSSAVLPAAPPAAGDSGSAAAAASCDFGQLLLSQCRHHSNQVNNHILIGCPAQLRTARCTEEQTQRVRSGVDEA